MSQGEFLHQQQPDHNAEIARIGKKLEVLTHGEAEQLCNDLHTQTTRLWEQCNGSFGALFDRLNLFTVRELSMFDIVIDEGDVDTYIRLQKDSQGTYSTTKLIRQNGRIIYREDAEVFSDTYEYVFGPNNNYVATIRLRDDIESGIKLARNDGELINQRTQYETSVLIAALETEVIPSIDRNKAILADVWTAVQSIEVGNR